LCDYLSYIVDNRLKIDNLNMV